MRTSVFELLAGQKDIRLVLFIPPLKKEHYAEEFKRANVLIEAVDYRPKKNYLEKLFEYYITNNLINTKSVHWVHRKQLALTDKRFQYYINRFLVRLFGGSRILRRIIRFLDYRLIKDKVFGQYFAQYKPDLVFLPDILAPQGTDMLRQAKKRRIFSIALVRSWDNLTSKGAVRVLPDKLIVPNEIVKKEAINLADMREENVFISGVPQFDYYFNYQPSPREEFFKRIKADPNKKLILFSPYFKPYTESVREIVKILDRAINSGELKNVQVLVRFPPSYKTKIEGFEPNQNIIFDIACKHFSLPDGTNDWEFMSEDVTHLADSLYFSDVTINYASTMTIDAAAFDKPVININFDVLPNLPPEKSIKCIYVTDHYQPILKSGGLRLANSEEELIEWLNRYLSHPEIDRDGREKIIREQYWKFDGKSGERVVQFILKFL